ncbi:Sin3 associated polypeptide p18-domain-containing protein [Microdochium bolleyi]|uniref:Sin3 associated polypeptide p18-domain-containing protein n=1 Tax=Microdochium bolleyi TaxID=196109 RepID=A0A136JKQ5_9PEZI|nr:Sin3 associated polypeptide p18-domain-containing protein [Microdochium bolleyi]
MDRHTTPPFMLRLFYRTGAFHRPDEFNVGDPADLPQHLTLHTWPDSTLTELSHQIAAASSPPYPQQPHDDENSRIGKILPEPAIGTRLVFRLIFASFKSVDNNNNSSSSGPHGRGHGGGGKFNVKDLGSVVIGLGGQGLDVSDLDALDFGDIGKEDSHLDRNSSLQLGGSDGSKTLSEARLVPGDYISCAILPPLDDGSVAPASAARTGRGFGAGEARPIGASAARQSSLSGRRDNRDRDWDRGRNERYRDDGGGYGRHGGGRRGSGIGYEGSGDEVTMILMGGLVGAAVVEGGGDVHSVDTSFQW